MSIYMKNFRYYCGECDASIVGNMHGAVEDDRTENWCYYCYNPGKVEVTNASVILSVTCPVCKFGHDVEYDRNKAEFCSVERRHDKYIWVTTEQRSGEYGFGPLYHLYGMKADANEGELLRSHLKDFWGDGTYQDNADDWYYYHPTGDIVIAVQSWALITEEQVQCAKKIGFTVLELR